QTSRGGDVRHGACLMLPGVSPPLGDVLDLPPAGCLDSFRFRSERRLRPVIFGRSVMKRCLTWGGACAFLISLIALATAAHAADATSFYKVKTPVSDDGATTGKVDPNLINGWGLVAASTTPWWVADNGADKSTIYRPSGRRLPLVVGVAGAPTGIVANEGKHFM